MTDTIAAAWIAAWAGGVSLAVNWLMNLSVKERGKQYETELTRLKSELASSEERLRSSLARDLAAHESVLRVQADVQLSSHEKSWSLLRELTSAIYGAHRELSRALRARAKHMAGGPEPIFADAVSSVLNLEMLSAAAPPEVDLDAMRSKFKAGLHNMQFATGNRSVGASGEQVRPFDDFYSSVSNMLDDAIDLGKAAITNWNATLWDTASKIGKPRAVPTEENPK
jgi:hypothetical protein